MSVPLSSETTEPVLPAMPKPASSHKRELDFAATLFRTLFFLALIAAVAAIAGAGLYGLSHSNRIYEGVSVAGVEVGGMTRSEAKAALRDPLRAATSHPVILTNGEQQFSLDPRAAGIEIDLDATVNQAFSFGRNGNVLERSGDWFTAILDGHQSGIEVSYDQASLDATLMQIAPSITRPAIDAYVRKNAEGNPELVPELPGIGFDLATTRNSMIAMIASLENRPVQIAAPIIPAAVEVADLNTGFSQIESAVSSSLVLKGTDTSWELTPDQIRQIVSVGGDQQRLIVNRDAVQSIVETIASQANRSVKDASITVTDGLLAVDPSVTGVSVNVAESANLIIGALEQGSTAVSLSYQEQQPRITDEQAAAAVTIGEEILNRGVELTWEDGSTEIGRGQLLAALTVAVNPDREQPFQFGFNAQTLSETLSNTFRSVEVPVIEPILRYVGGKITVVQESQTGIAVDADATMKNVVDALLGNQPEAQMVLIETEPKLTDEAIAAITLTDVLAESSTYYGDSSDARRHNVETAAALQAGWLIGPGEQFSFAHFVGSVDEESGFMTGFGIVDDPSTGGVTTAPVVGGGICQVSTTIFQAAFWAGLEIDERYTHPYWIQAYGEPPRGMKGLDAMVNIEDSGSLDLKFTNTTDHWIAIDVVADGTTVNVKIRGVDPGWNVEISDPLIYNEIDPSTETRYEESPELPEGSRLQVEFAQPGFTSEITRTITAEDGELLDVSTVIGTYAPSQNTILEGTGAPVASPSPES
ncbi:MAG: peptidoglycan binding domain-containing protein [Thermomicrobiales bacterium]|nr:peptidoglycan binding domain-containing protein [Thermomicrobiales bacterium]